MNVVQGAAADLWSSGDESGSKDFGVEDTGIENPGSMNTGNRGVNEQQSDPRSVVQFCSLRMLLPNMNRSRLAGPKLPHVDLPLIACSSGRNHVLLDRLPSKLIQ